MDRMAVRQKLEALQLDVVIGGGGWRGQYAGGAVSIFQALEKLQLRVVPRYSGASIGAITAAYFASASGYSDYIASHNAWQVAPASLTEWSMQCFMPTVYS